MFNVLIQSFFLKYVGKLVSEKRDTPNRKFSTPHPLVDQVITVLRKQIRQSEMLHIERWKG
jgi:hypothetical protein